MYIGWNCIIQLNILFFHVFFRSLVLIRPVPRVCGGYRGSILFSLVLILRIPAIPGDRGGRIFFRQGFFGGHFMYKLVYYKLNYINFTRN
jgi:hypothetical protein